MLGSRTGSGGSITPTKESLWDCLRAARLGRTQSSNSLRERKPSVSSDVSGASAHAPDAWRVEALLPAGRSVSGTP